MIKDKLIYGKAPVLHALKEDNLEVIFINNKLKSTSMLPIVKLAKEKGVMIKAVPEQKLNFICKNKIHQQIAAYTKIVDYANYQHLLLQIIEAGRTPKVFILENITDVRNAGAILRSALCFEIDLVILAFKMSVPVLGDLAKTSAGALFHIPICRVSSIPDVIKNIKAYGLSVFACSEKGNTLLYDMDLTHPCAFILGGEERGISQQVLALCDDILRIPIMGDVPSLNVAVAGSIVAYETLRQEKCKKIK